MCFRFIRLAALAALTALIVAPAPAAAAEAPGPIPPADPAPGSGAAVAAAAQPEEVNVASASRGATASGGEVANDLLAMIDESSGTAAQLAPDLGTGAAVTTIRLADTTDVTRIALEIGSQKGLLKVYAVDAGQSGASAAVLDSARLVATFRLDGSRSTVNADLGHTAVKALAIVWVPEAPGASLAVANVGVFTRTPPAAALVAGANSSTTSAVAVVAVPPAGGSVTPTVVSAPAAGNVGTSSTANPATPTPAAVSAASRATPSTSPADRQPGAIVTPVLPATSTIVPPGAPAAIPPQTRNVSL